jgi:DNA-directed RNA polymerase specialized sigma24 family protein
LDKFDDSRPLKPWLFGTAHNHSCIYFLRKSKVRAEAEALSASPDILAPPNLANLDAKPALERLVTMLPPMEQGRRSAFAPAVSAESLTAKLHS